MRSVMTLQLLPGSDVLRRGQRQQTAVAQPCASASGQTRSPSPTGRSPPEQGRLIRKQCTGVCPIRVLVQAEKVHAPSISAWLSKRKEKSLKK